jgi:(R,R)-butanediol dehydrogenase / meso-butanediol dehydrogenase / diacetyl reductase
MKAAVWYGYKDVRVMEVSEPSVNPGHVKVKVAWAGICGTDRHEYVGPNFIPVSRPHRLTGRTAPLIQGHEFTGVITELGEGVEDWKVGDRITASGNLVCGECEFCKSGRINICEKLGFNGVSTDGAFAEYIVIPKHQLFKIPDNVTLEEAVIAEPLACGAHATKLAGESINGATVAIVGPGIIGISALLAAKLSGAERILMIGVGKNREELVKSLGAEYCDIKTEDPVEYVKKWTEGKMCNVVYECVGIESSLKTAINISRNSSKVMIMGVFEKEPSFPMNLFQEGERILLTSQAYVDEISTVLDNMSGGLIPVKELITAKIELDNIVKDGFEELLAYPDKHIKIAIKVSE